MADSTKNNQLEVILKDQGVAKENAQALLEAFGAPFEEAGLILADYQTIKVTDETDVDGMMAARTKRLALKKTRTTVENKRKELKEGIVKQGRVIDSVAKFVKEVIAPAEEYLQLQEDFAKIKQAERREAIKAERIKAVSQYADPYVYNLDAMDTAQFDALIAQLKADFERKEAERVAEEKRIADEAEAERKRQAEVEAENARLKKEAEAKEIADAKLRGRINAMARLGLVLDERTGNYAMDDLEIDETVATDLADDDTFNEALDAIAKVIADRAEETKKAQAEKQAAIDAENAKARAEADAERTKREELEKADRERRDREAKAKADAEEAERKALLAPDKQKLITFAEAINMIRNEKLPAVKTKAAQDIVNDIDAELDKLEASIKAKANRL